MVGYLPNRLKVKAEQEEKLYQDSTELKKSNDPVDFTALEEDFPESFLDSILDFSGWVEESLDPSMADVVSAEEKRELGIPEKCLEIKGGDLGSLIEEEMGKVSLRAENVGVKNDEIASSTAVAGSSQGGEVELEKCVNGEETSEVEDAEKDDVNGDVNKTGDNGDDVSGVGSKKMSEEEEEEEESSSEEDEESSSEESSSEEESSSSSSSSDDEDDEEEGENRKKVKNEEEEVEMEEGEIRDVEVEEMVAWSDDEDDNGVKGPIRSKNEVQDLPPVPPVNVILEPHHQILPVGVVLSILGTQVIVEGVEKHNPLSEGSILWITETRSPLGIVDEIFGPVKNPYYMVRYNSESEVPTGIQQGSLISFVPEFADYVLNNSNLYKKGYDASGENDEELSDEVEFSDDEKEAEYKKMMQNSKRGSNEQKVGNKKKDKKSRNRGGNWKNDQQCSPAQQSDSTSIPIMRPAFSPSQQPHNFAGPSSGVWTNGIPSIQQPNMGFLPNGYPQNVPFMQPNFPQQQFQNLSLPNAAPFHPQLNIGGQILPSNFVLQGGSPNFCAGPAFPSWPANMPQTGFSETQVGQPAAFQGLLPNPSMNMLPQGVMMPNMRPPMFSTLQVETVSNMRPPLPGGIQMENNNSMNPSMPNVLQMENNNGMRPSFVGGSGEASQNPNRGNGNRNHGGRKPFQRGGGRSRGGGRGGQHSR